MFLCACIQVLTIIAHTHTHTHTHPLTLDGVVSAPEHPNALNVLSTNKQTIFSFFLSFSGSLSFWLDI